MDAHSDLIGQSAEIEGVRRQIERLLGRQADVRRLPRVLILGETGTGKGLLARSLHRAGPRAGAPFVDVNCAAIPETMLEAEMFGYERGAFTDARQSKPGLFQAAHGGTLFLDEVGLLPAALQGKFLTAIESGAVRRLGSTRSEPADVWILSATSEDLAASIRGRRFREDLYHRLAVLTIRLPPLRERGDDVLLIARHFLAQACGDYGLPAKELAPDACAALRAYPWPGNVREVANVIERVTLLCDAATVSADALGLPPLDAAPPAIAPPAPPALLQESMTRVEREHLLAALERTGWNITRAAADLGISRDTLRHRIAAHALTPPASARTRRPMARRVPAETAPPSAAREAADQPSAACEERRVALLRVARDEPEPPRAGRELERAVEKVRALGGVVHELSPMRLTAAFGLEPIEDAPRRAALAALAVRRGAERSRQSADDSPKMRMAIHVGLVRVGDTGGALEIEREAAREAETALEAMLSVAEPGAVVVGQSALSSLERRFELVPLEPLADRATPLYRLIGHERSGLEIGQRMTAFVGRERELDLLMGGLGSAMDGRGRAIGIVGEAGIGKSRLLFELRRRLQSLGVAHLEGHCLSYAGATPYQALSEIVRQMFGIVDGDTPEKIATRIDTGLETLGLDGPRAAACLLHALDVPAVPGALAGLSAEAIKTRTFETLRRLYLRQAHGAPLVIIVEDLHLIDRTSQEWLSFMMESVPRARLLLLLSYRPGYHPPWMDRSDATQIALRPLGHSASLSVVESVAGAPLPESLAGSIVDRAEGNPFFLEELCRACVEHNGVPRAVPDTIQDVVRVRIDRLADEPRRLLETAAVLGRSASIALLRAVWDDSPLEPSLRVLARLEFLYQEGAGAESSYVFKHALVQEIAHDSIAAARRQALHARAGRSLEALHAGRLDDVVDRLAYHYSRAGDADGAVTYLMRLADKAVRAFGYVEALAAVEEALRHVDGLEPGSRDRQLLALVLRQVDALTYLSRYEDVVRALTAQQKRAERLGDPSVAGRFFFWLARTYGILGDSVRAVEHARRALAEAARCGDEATTGKAYFALAYACFWSGRPAEGIEHGREALVHLDHTEEPRWAGSCYWVNGINHSLLGEFDRALEAFDRQRTIADTIGDPRLLSSSIMNTATIHALTGEWDRAIEICRRGLALSRDTVDRALGLGFLGGIYLEKGDAAQAIPCLEESVERYGEVRVRQTQGWFTALLGEAYFLGGDAERGQAAATEGLRIVSAIGYRWGIGWAERILGRIALARDLQPDAERHLAAALAVFTEMGARYEVARTALDLARLAHRRSDRATTRAHLSGAHELFRLLGVPLRAEGARRLAEELGIGLSPENSAPDVPSPDRPTPG